MAADMLAAYYGKGCDSRELFAGRKIEKEESFPTHLNRHNVIRLDIQRFLFDESHLDIFIDKIQEAVIRELEANIFKEYSMLNPGSFAEYFGFTEEEVKSLCRKYGIDYGKTREWYDGYLIGDFHIYNPQAVTELMDSGAFRSYWTGTETYEALKIYIDMNFDGLKESIIGMLSDVRCEIDPSTSQNDMTTFKSKDDVLTLLLHLGYLSFDEKTSEVFIPNQEIAREFMRSVKAGGWDGLVQALRRSDGLLQKPGNWMGKQLPREWPQFTTRRPPCSNTTMRILLPARF